MSKTRQVSEIERWDGNQKLDRSAMSAGAEMPKAQKLCMLRVQGQRYVKNSGMYPQWEALAAISDLFSVIDCLVSLNCF
jgi:hypothetical protein